jgi:hypothetical protein
MVLLVGIQLACVLVAVVALERLETLMGKVKVVMVVLMT